MPTQYPCSFAFRLTDTAAAQLARVADAHGLKPAVFARQVVVREIGTVMKLPPVQRRIMNAELFRSAIAELSRLGNNLNQIAHASNRGEPPRLITASLDNLQAELVAAMRRVTAAMGIGSDV